MKVEIARLANRLCELLNLCDDADFVDMVCSAVSPRHVGSTSVWGNGHYALHHQGLDDCLDRDFGKTWFLSREEAEAALKEAEE